MARRKLYPHKDLERKARCGAHRAVLCPSSEIIGQPTISLVLLLRILRYLFGTQGFHIYGGG